MNHGQQPAFAAIILENAALAAAKAAVLRQVCPAWRGAIKQARTAAQRGGRACAMHGMIWVRVNGKNGDLRFEKTPFFRNCIA
jgi:hypothetical protein